MNPITQNCQTYFKNVTPVNAELPPIWGRSHQTILAQIYSLLFESLIFSPDGKIMNALIKWSSLQKSVSKLMPKKFYEIDPLGL
jgi:hypothetical protein